MSASKGFGYENDDSEIEQDIRSELEATQDPAKGSLLGIAVRRGSVQLTGFVDSYARKLAIASIAGSVVGVRDVRNHLEVRPPDAGLRADDDIQQAARRALDWDARVSDRVGVEVTDGIVRLLGIVDRFAQREAAEEAIRNMVGVRDIINEIKVAPAARSTDLDFDIESAIRRHFGMAARRVWVVAQHGSVTVSGVVPAFGMLDEIERIVRAVPGVVRLDNRLIVG